jgi:hypothetical protein
MILDPSGFSFSDDYFHLSYRESRQNDEFGPLTQTERQGIQKTPLRAACPLVRNWPHEIVSHLRGAACQGFRAFR